MNINTIQADILKALGHPVRLRIIKALMEKELCVCELNMDVEFSQSNMSQHLKILKDSQILSQRKEGLKVYYKINNVEVIKIVELVEKIVKDQINQKNSLIL